MSKLWIIIFLFVSTNLFSQTFEDKKIVGVLKIYAVDTGYYTQVTYVDTVQLKYSGFDLYDIIIRSYLETYPMLYPGAVVESLRRNMIRFREIYYETIKDPD